MPPRRSPDVITFNGAHLDLEQRTVGFGGFTYDAVNDRLIVADSGLEAGGGSATTGDTIYAITDPFATPGVIPVARMLWRGSF